MGAASYQFVWRCAICILDYGAMYRVGLGRFYGGRTFCVCPARRQRVKLCWRGSLDAYFFHPAVFLVAETTFSCVVLSGCWCTCGGVWYVDSEQ
jgi:hypothetical protein